jgi:hypothetical protein
VLFVATGVNKREGLSSSHPVVSVAYRADRRRDLTLNNTDTKPMTNIDDRLHCPATQVRVEESRTEGAPLPK